MTGFVRDRVEFGLGMGGFRRGRGMPEYPEDYFFSYSDFDEPLAESRPWPVGRGHGYMSGCPNPYERGPGVARSRLSRLVARDNQNAGLSWTSGRGTPPGSTSAHEEEDPVVSGTGQPPSNSDAHEEETPTVTGTGQPRTSDAAHHDEHQLHLGTCGRRGASRRPRPRYQPPSRADEIRRREELIRKWTPLLSSRGLAVDALDPVQVETMQPPINAVAADDVIQEPQETGQPPINALAAEDVNPKPEETGQPPINAAATRSIHVPELWNSFSSSETADLPAGFTSGYTAQEMDSWVEIFPGPSKPRPFMNPWPVPSCHASETLSRSSVSEDFDPFEATRHWVPFKFQLRCGHWISINGFIVDSTGPPMFRFPLLQKGPAQLPSHGNRFGEPICIEACEKARICKRPNHTCRYNCAHLGPCSPCREGCEPDLVQLLAQQADTKLPIRIVKEGQKCLEELILLSEQEHVIVLEAGTKFPSGLLSKNYPQNASHDGI